MGYKCNYFWTKAKGQTLNIYPVNSACRAGVLLYRGGINLHLYNKNFIVRN